MRTPLAYAAKLAGATGAAYLGLLLACLLWNAPRLLLVSVSDAELVGGYFVAERGAFRLAVMPPSADVFAVPELFLAGPLLFALALVAPASALLSRLSDWPRLAGAFTVFWIAFQILDAVGAFLGRGRGALADFVRVAPGSLWNGASAAMALAAVVGVTTVWSLGRAWATLTGEGRRKRLGLAVLWLLAPLLLLRLALPDLEGPQFWILRSGPAGAVFWLAAAAIVVVVTVSSSRAKAWQGSVAGGLAVLLLAGAGYGLAARIDGGVIAPAEPTTELVRSEHWEVEYPSEVFDRAASKAWAARADGRLARIAERSSAGLPQKRLEARITVGAPRSDFDRRIGRRDDEAAARPLVALTSELEPVDARQEALILLRDRWGEPGAATLSKAAARYAVGLTHEDGLLGYARRIASEERPYQLEELFAEEGAYLSPLVRDVMGGAWVGSMVERHGIEIVQTIYLAAPERLADAIGTDVPALETAWRKALLTEIPAPQPTTERAIAFHKGISFSHEVGGNWGYGSPAAAVELARIRALGADAIALVPYAFTRAPEETSIRFRADESDERVVASIRQAKALGLAVTLKPHLWGSGFTGEIRFARDQRFEEWFSQYRRWIVHFARLAELHEVDLLVIGNELAGVTGREQAWRELIRDTRRVYRGPVTYASHWDGEFEKVAFWDDLDVIGVNFYFPLSDPGEAPSPRAARLADAARRLAAAAERFGKRILFTEVGFPSLTTAAEKPWEDAVAPLDLELQELCYETIFQAFYKQDWLAGMYWWKWPSHGRAGPYDGRHYPAGKPAEKTLSRWYEPRR